MEIKQLVETIVRELMTTMKTEAVQVQSPKVLYILCDSTAHEAYLDHFILLSKEGIQYDLLFLDGETSGWLGKSRIESGGPGKVIAVDEFAPAPIELPNEYDGIVIPEIDLDNAGRISLGMKGTVKSEIVFAALVLNKYVLVGEDISGIKRADRRTLKTLALPKSYQKLFDYYKQEMQMYGVQFAPLSKLAERVVSEFIKRGIEQTDQSVHKFALQVSSAVSMEAAPIQTEDMATFEGKLLSADWVTRQSRSLSRLKVLRGTILSPLAKDMLRDRGITIDYLDER